MNTFISALNYKMRGQLNLSVWYLWIYSASLVLTHIILIQTSVITESSGSLMYRLSGSIIFMFAISIRFREDFDFLLTLSNTRRNICLALLGTGLGFSAFFSGLILLERVIVDHFNQILGYHNINDLFHSFAPYASDNLFLQFLYFLMLSTCCSFAGVLLGSLFYRLGKKFMLVFWLAFSGIPAIILPMMLWTQHQQGELTQSMKSLGVFLNTFDVLSATGVLLVVTLVFGIAAYWNIHKLPQR
jgi:hypothetical protein